MTNRQTETKITALYERLSNDDRLLGDSNSIVNQKAMLESYAQQNNFSNLQHYTDDGFSGGNFERPSWKRMVSDIQAGKVGTVIVKDMSRVGRDYLQTGFYTEVLFKQQGVRFIAVSNGVDSTDASSSEFAPFLNIMNEWYLRDCSRKLKAAYRTKGNSGKPTTSHPPYGYRKSPDDKNQWIVDEESAMVVKRIFNLCVEGYGPGQIAKILMNDKIETPSYYWGKQGISAWQSKYDPNRPYDWTSDSVARMLERIEYLGHTVNFKTFRQDYKNNKMLHNPKEKWKIFENTHEPIIDKETWELVQKLRETPKRHDFSDKPNPLTGLLYCADCGAKLYNDSQKAYSQKHGYKPDPMTGYYGSDYYECKNYKLASVRETALCTSHRVNTNALIKLILETIRLVSEYAITNKAEFIEKVKAISLSQHNQDVNEQKKRLAKNEKRYTELDELIKKLYESYATGKLTEKRFELLSAGYEQEQENLSNEIDELKKCLETYKEETDNVNQFLELAKKYTDFSVLTTPMLNEFIDKIIIHAPYRDEVDRFQQIDIYFNFIGQFELPEVEPTPEELAEIEKQRQRRLRNKLYTRRYREKKKAEKLAAQKAAEQREKTEKEQKQADEKSA